MKKILIVDDQAFIRHMLGMELSRSGYKVHYADNGKTGFEEAVIIRPDLILLDIMMPVMDGYECCKKIRDNEFVKTVPVIFLSANNQKTAVIKAVQSGGTDFVVKSPNPTVLLQKVKKLFGEE